MSQNLMSAHESLATAKQVSWEDMKKAIRQAEGSIIPLGERDLIDFSEAEEAQMQVLMGLTEDTSELRFKGLYQQIIAEYHRSEMAAVRQILIWMEVSSEHELMMDEMEYINHLMADLCGGEEEAEAAPVRLGVSTLKGRVSRLWVAVR